MKRIYLVIFLVLLLGCEKSVEPIKEYYSEIKGIVINDNEKEYLDSVLIGFKDPKIPDSVLFIGDSISLQVLQNARNSSPYSSPFLYSIGGIFQFGFPFAARPTVDYKLMFANKAGYKLWKYAPYKDTVYHVNDYIDSIVIVLSNKTIN